MIEFLQTYGPVGAMFVTFWLVYEVRTMKTTVHGMRDALIAKGILRAVEAKTNPPARD